MQKNKNNLFTGQVNFKDSTNPISKRSRSVYLARFDGDITFEETNQQLDEKKKVKTSPPIEFIFDR